MTLVHRDRYNTFLRRAGRVNITILIERRRLLTLLSRAAAAGGEYEVDDETFDKLRTFLLLPNSAVQTAEGGPLSLYSFVRLCTRELEEVAEVIAEEGMDEE